jgi:hypothetical protein
MHAGIEPIAALILILSSWIFGFSNNGTAQAVTIALGAIMLAAGSLTDWRLSLMRLIPLRIHFMTDLLIGVLLIISPFIFGFSQNSAATRFAIIFGALEVVTALSTSWDPATDMGTAAPRTSGTRAHTA